MLSCQVIYVYFKTLMQRIMILIIFNIFSFCLHAEDTELKLYRPFEQAALITKETILGNCKVVSQLIRREDAWRCEAAGKIYDPCFIKFNAPTQALCPQSPWSDVSIKIIMRTSTDNSQQPSLNMAETSPWAIELKSGEKCQAVEGKESFDGLAINYRCDNQSYLLGTIQRCETMWTILQKSPQQVHSVSIAKAWF